MGKRPLSVAVISWLVLIYSVVWILSYIAYYRMIMDHLNSIDTGVHYYYLCVATAFFNIVTSIFMLRGDNWSRLFFTIWNIMMIVYSYVVAHSSTIISSTFVWMIIFIIFLIFLYSRSSNEFFRLKRSAV